VHYDDGGGYAEIASYSPTNDEAICFLFDEVQADAIRVDISGVTVPSIGVIFAGKRISPPSGVVGSYEPFSWSESIDVLGGETITGQFVGQRIRRQGRSGFLDLGRVSRGWFEAEGLAFVQHFNSGKPFFCVPSPESIASEVAYCWRAPREKEIVPALSEGHGWVRLAMGFRAYA